ncbi:MAG TPA: hypothetical protein VHT24_02980 [Pseudacidobacterium sp.]|nr:hypothetical protein [Pseudacidobacterium sp.]
MSPVARTEDTAVFAFAVIYFLLVHIRSPRIGHWLPKELAVGVLFAAATAVPAWSRSSWNARFSLIPLVVLFAILCWLNCVAIEVWEQRYSQQRELVHTSTHWAGWNFSLLTQATAALAFILALLSFHHPVAVCCLYLASGMAALLLQWLTRHRAELTTMQFRIAVDAALLTPVLFLAWIR